MTFIRGADAKADTQSIKNSLNESGKTDRYPLLVDIVQTWPGLVQSG